MEEVQEPKFLCKFCNKACSTGKSLGGHMRCHLDLIASARKQKLKTLNSESAGKNQEMAMNINSGDQSCVVSDLKEKNLCKKCGRSFSSEKALAGHLKCHSRKGSEEEEERHLCEKCGKDFHSIRALYGHMKIHSKRNRGSKEEESSSVKSLSDLETMCPVRKKRSTIKYKITSVNPPVSSLNESHSVISGFDEAQDAAMCLIMLSKGVKNWNETLFYENQSFFCKEEMPNCVDDNDDDGDKHCISWKNLSEICSENKTVLEVCVNGCISIEQFKKPLKASVDVHDLELGESFTFADDFEVKENNNLETEILEGAAMAVPESSTRNKEHVCPICFKVFQSGQALGGHKRAHYNGSTEIKVKKESLSDVHEILDLNLPVNAAAAVSVTSMEDRLWCLGNSLLISN